MKNVIMPKTQREFMQANIINIKRLKLTCKNCLAEVTFDINARFSTRALRECSVCGVSYKIDADNNPIIKAQELLNSINENQDATFSFLCEED